MKLKYYKEDDILVIRLGNEPYDYAEMKNNFVVHFSKKDKPIRIEILDASKFFKKESEALPREIKEKYFAPLA